MFNKQIDINKVNEDQFKELISRFDQLESKVDKLESKVDKLESKVDIEVSCLKDRINQTTTLMLFFNGTAMLAILGSVITLVVTHISSK